MAVGLGRKGDIWTFGSWGCMNRDTQTIEVVGVVGGEKIDIEAGAGIPVLGISGAEAIDVVVSDVQAFTAEPSIADVKKIFGLTSLAVAVSWASAVTEYVKRLIATIAGTRNKGKG